MSIKRLSLIALICAAGAFCAAARQAASLPTGKSVRQIELKELPLADAVRLISRQTDLSIVASQDAGKTKVSLFLQGVSPQTVIEELCHANKLWYRRDERTGVIRIITLPEFQQDLTTFRESHTRVFSVMYPNAVSIATAIEDLYGERVQLSRGDEDLLDESRDISERFNRFDLIDQRSQGLGLNGVDSSTSYGRGYSSGYLGQSSSYRSNTYARRGSRANSPNAELSEELRPLSPGQAEALSEASSDQRADSDREAQMNAYRRRQANIYVRVQRHSNLIVVRTSDPGALEEIARLVQRLDVPTPMVLLEVKVLSVQLGDDFNSIFDYQFSDGSTIGGGFTAGEVQQSPSDAFGRNLRKLQPMTPGGTGLDQRDLIFQFVSNSFRLRMQLLEEKNRITELATPLLLTANDEVARLFVGEERPIVRNISSQVVLNNNNTSITPNTTIDFRPVGTTLLITPNINADRTVTLRILQENSSISAGAASIPVVTNAGTVISQPVDVVAARTLSGTVVAKDGLMLAVGGLIEERVTDKRAHVPILGKVPLLGFFFRRQETGRSRSELVIMIRPHVLSTPSEAESIRTKLLEDLSIHPAAINGAEALDAFNSDEVLQPSLPRTPIEALFRYHSVTPADY